MEFRRYKLFGYLNLFPGLSGFLYPVFLNNGSLYLDDSSFLNNSLPHHLRNHYRAVPQLYCIVPDVAHGRVDKSLYRYLYSPVQVVQIYS